MMISESDDNKDDAPTDGEITVDSDGDNPSITQKEETEIETPEADNGEQKSPPPTNRFSSDENPEKEKPKKRNLKNKRIMGNLNKELDDMGALYADDATVKKKGAKKIAAELAKKKDDLLAKIKGPAILLSILGVLGYGYYIFTMPVVGSIGFGMCKVFLERWVEYPSSLRLSEIKEFRDSVRIWYIQTDSFGQYRMEPIQCFYANTPERGFHMEKITINRRDLEPQVVNDFNRSMPSIRMVEEYLHIPYPLPDNIADMR